MAKSKPYNGHKNWNHWNVALWIGNDYGLYSMAKNCIKDCSGHRDAAAWQIFYTLKNAGTRKTPDGAPYSFTTIRAAIRDL